MVSSSIKKKLRDIPRLRALYERALHAGVIPGKKFVPWQVVRANSEDKWALIQPVCTAHAVASLLDVGCDAGQVTRLAAAQKIFAVGIDQNTSMLRIKDPLHGVCFGNIRLDAEMIQRLPMFDMILLLSVHHQWVKGRGDEWAVGTTRELFNKATKAMIFEFSAINQRFGFDPPQFMDNDQASVRQYATAWLNRTLPDAEVQFLGSVKERTEEPFRYMFAAIK